MVRGPNVPIVAKKVLHLRKPFSPGQTRVVSPLMDPASVDLFRFQNSTFALRSHQKNQNSSGLCVHACMRVCVYVHAHRYVETKKYQAK